MQVALRIPESPRTATTFNVSAPVLGTDCVRVKLISANQLCEGAAAAIPDLSELDRSGNVRGVIGSRLRPRMRQ